MNYQKCFVCGSDKSVLVPGGISKGSGKPYQAFYACPNKCKKPTQVPTSPAYQPPVEKVRDFNAEARGKVRFGFSIEDYKAQRPLDKKVIDRINKWTDFVMTGEQFSFIDKPQERIIDVPLADDGFPEEEDIKVDGIPF